MKYWLYIQKRRIEDIFIYPFVLVGRWLAKRNPLPQTYDTFYFFPFFHIGGAEKVHAQVAEVTGNKNCIIFFTRKSADKGFLKLFQESGCTCIDISKHTDNKWQYWNNLIWRGKMSYYINSQSKMPLVFNGQCNFGYKLSPWLYSSVPQIELIHSLCSFSYIRIPFLPFIHRTIMISTLRVKEHIELYRRYGIPSYFDQRIQFIMNAIDLPRGQQPPKPSQPFVALYAGRSTAEKRVHLIAEMAQRLAHHPNIEFWFMGDVAKAVPPNLHPYCHFLGNLSGAEEIEKVYRQAHLLILTSDTEGFPMVVMEGMAYGLAIVSTPVGELPIHVKNGVHGWLFSTVNDGEKIVTEGAAYIKQLADNNDLLQKISAENIAYAFTHFGKERFAQQYQSLFLEMRNKGGQHA